jgi:hypothetical protein
MDARGELLDPVVRAGGARPYPWAADERKVTLVDVGGTGQRMTMTHAPACCATGSVGRLSRRGPMTVVVL